MDRTTTFGPTQPPKPKTMKTSLCMALLSAGLFSAQLTFAQSPTAAPQQVGAVAVAAPTCPVVNIDCLTKPLVLTADQVARMTSINKQYAAQCSSITASKMSTTDMTQKLADVIKKRDAELRAVLTREQSPKWDAAVATCATKPAPAGATTVPYSK